MLNRTGWLAKRRRGARGIGAAVAMVLSAAATAPLVGDPAPVVMRIKAEEARQGAASDGRHVYAIDNSRIGKYRIADGRRVAQWTGDPAVFPHLNSCTVVGARLVCASSNYPALPQASSVEVFDAKSLRHVASHSFGITEGSLTVLDRHAGAWWAVFAHYDGRGGEPGRDARHTQLVRLDDSYRVLGRWTLPREVLERIRPYSISGASWSADGRLALSGHDLPEIYLVSLPAAGTVLRLDAVVPVTSEGQAIDWDPRRQSMLWTIIRGSREIVLSDLADALRR